MGVAGSTQNLKKMNLKKTLAKAILPNQVFEKLRAMRWRRHQRDLLQSEGLLEAAARYIERNGTVIKYGPFAGVIYPLDTALTHHSIPLLLGTYEEEIHPIIETIKKRKYDVVIDIGSAEGYYAIGLAKHLQTKVLAYDPSPIAKTYCRKAARLNGVSDLIELRDMFLPSDIAAFRDQNVCCICDCEGFETALFDEKTITHTARWDIIVELHGDEIIAKLPNLGWPHEVSVIPTKSRNGFYQELEGLGQNQAKLLSEFRGISQRWLWCDSHPGES